jgi:hypothetical protein
MWRLPLVSWIGTALAWAMGRAHSIASTVDIRRVAKVDAFRCFMTPPKRQPTEESLRQGRAHVGPGKVQLLDQILNRLKNAVLYF